MGKKEKKKAEAWAQLKVDSGSMKKQFKGQNSRT